MRAERTGVPGRGQRPRCRQGGGFLNTLEPGHECEQLYHVEAASRTRRCLAQNKIRNHHAPVGPTFTQFHWLNTFVTADGYRVSIYKYCEPKRLRPISKALYTFDTASHGQAGKPLPGTGDPEPWMRRRTNDLHEATGTVATHPPRVAQAMLPVPAGSRTIFQEPVRSRRHE